MDIVSKAREYAVTAHTGQSYGNGPYTDHLKQTVQVLRDFGIEDEVLLAAGWLHDSIEDTSITIKDLRLEFGERIAKLVDALTDGPGATRGERKARPYSLIPTVPGATILKLADRIANVEEARQNHIPRFIRQYRIEHPAFEQALRREGTPYWKEMEMWDRLERAIR